MRDFVHVDDVARANLAALRAVVDARAGALRRLQRRLRAPGPDPRRGRAGRPRAPAATIAPEVTGGYRLGDVRHVVASPARAARRARLHAPRSRPSRGCRRSPPRRCATDACHQPCRAGAGPAAPTTTWSAEPPAPPAARAAARSRQQSATARTAARSAPPRPCSSGTASASATTTTAAPTSSSAHPARHGATRGGRPRPAPAASSGPALTTRAARLPHTSTTAAGRARSRPSSAPAAPGRPPTTRSRTARTPSTTASAAPRRDRQRPPRPAGDQHREREQPQQRQAVGHHHARSPAAARRAPPTTSRRRTRGEREAGQPPRGHGREQRVRRDAMKTAAGASTRNGAARRATVLGAERPQRDQHGDRGRRREHA